MVVEPAFAALVFAEVVVLGCLVLLGRAGRWVFCVFLAAVSVSIVLQLVQGSDLPCGCGGSTGTATGTDHLLSLGRNALLAVVALGGRR